MRVESHVESCAKCGDQLRSALNIDRLQAVVDGHGGGFPASTYWVKCGNCNTIAGASTVIDAMKAWNSQQIDRKD